MAAGQLNQVIRHVRRVSLQGGGELTDGQLLDCFIARRDEAAFEALVRRHGPMVLGVCRRIAGHAEDAEDAFQAAFLVLARKANCVAPRDAVGNWLYGVALRTALKARGKSARRRAREKQVVDMPQRTIEAETDGQLLKEVLDQELSRLPDKYRAAIVLCELQGRSRKAAARELKLHEGTLSSRLATARKLLAERLARRGLLLTAAGLTLLLSRNATAAVPATLIASTMQTVVAGAAGAVSAQVLVLAEGVLAQMFLTKLKTLAAATVAVLVLCGGSTMLWPGAPAAPAASAQVKAQAPVPKEAPKPDDKKDAAKDDKKDEKKDAAIVTAIVIQGSGSVTIRQTGKEMINGAAVQPGDVQNGVLTLDGAEDFDVEVKELSAIQHDGSGALMAKDLKTKRLTVATKGSGDISASGTADVQEITLNGSAAFKGKDLKGKEAIVRIGGSGDAVVHVTEKLKGIISGSGSVKYVGMPKVESEVTGSGEVRQFREGEDAGAANLQAGARAQAQAAAAQARAAAARARAGLVPGFLPDDGRLGAVLEIPSPILVAQLDLPKGQGMVISAVNADSAAAKAGIKANDILLELNGKAVPSEGSEFAKLLEGIKAKTPVAAVVLRKGKKETIKELTLPEPEPKALPDRRGNPVRGGAAGQLVVQAVDAKIGTLTVLLADGSKKVLNLSKPDLPVTDASGKAIRLTELPIGERVQLTIAENGDVLAIRVTPSRR